MLNYLYFFVFDSHFQVNNTGAIKFYERFGFEIDEEKENYYKKIEPATPMFCIEHLKARLAPKSWNPSARSDSMPRILLTSNCDWDMGQDFWYTAR